MAITAGVLSQVSVSAQVVSLSATATTGGTAPYTYQWYRSTTSGFSPGAGNLIAGATALTLTDSGLIPNTQYYYKLVTIDAVPNTVTYTQLAVATTAPVLNPNQFAQTSYLGTIDLRFPYNSVSVQIDVSQATPLFCGGAVKMVNSVGGVPKVVGCSANSDGVFGFINFDIKTVSFVAGSTAEISMRGNVMYLYSTGVIARGARVTLDLSTNGGVASITTGANVVGWAYDSFPAAGTLGRIFLDTPSFLTAP